MVISSAISKAVRFAIFLRRVAGRVPSFSCRVFMAFSCPWFSCLRLLSCLWPSAFQRAVYIAYRLSQSIACKTSSGFHPSCRRRRAKQPGVLDRRPPPLAVCLLETEFLHVRVVGAFQLGDVRAASLRPEYLNKTRLCVKLVLYLCRQLVKFGLKFVVKDNRPFDLLCSRTHMISSALCANLNSSRVT